MTTPATTRRPGLTDAQVATLTEMWLRGETSARIAATLGITRNTVLGKIQRLGLIGKGGSRGVSSRAAVPPRPASPEVPPKADAKPAPAARPRRSALDPSQVQAPAPAASPPDPLALFFAAYPVAAALAPMRDRHCRFPIGDPVADEASFRFCGARTEVAGKSYCVEHRALCVQRVVTMRLPSRPLPDARRAA